MLFLESPAGVGFSYSADFQVDTNDNKVVDSKMRKISSK